MACWVIVVGVSLITFGISIGMLQSNNKITIPLIIMAAISALAMGCSLVVLFVKIFLKTKERIVRVKKMNEIISDFRVANNDREDTENI